DLRRRTVADGPDGSQTQVIEGFILKAFDIDRSIHAAPLSFAAAFDKLKAGAVHAVFATVSDPAELVTAAAAAGARLLPIEGSKVDRIRHDYRFLQLAHIPGNVYVNHPSPIRTIGVDKVLVC